MRESVCKGITFDSKSYPASCKTAAGLALPPGQGEGCSTAMRCLCNYSLDKHTLKRRCAAGLRQLRICIEDGASTHVSIKLLHASMPCQGAHRCSMSEPILEAL